ncbi:MAG: CaiB/BaiF CoA transferase family protein [Janthinobacterium lividum]
MKPLSELLVVDLTQNLSGPYCTMLLADAGAQVIKVERPGGDPSREMSPFVQGMSAYFMSINRNKKSIVLDLTQHDDLQVLHKLLKNADVLVENFKPGTMEKLGLSWDSLHEKFPRLTLASISGFGQNGPYRRLPAFDMVVQAMGGIMSLTGQPDAPPVRVGVSVGDLAAGIFAVIGVQSAIIQRHLSGLGSRVDISMLDCQVALLENAISRYQATGVVPGPLGARHPTSTPFGLFSCADGSLAITAPSDALFPKLCVAIGHPELALDERFATRPARLANRDSLERILEDILKTRKVADWMPKLTEAGVPFGKLNDMADLIDDPQLAARNMLVELRDDEGRVLKVPGNPVKIGALVDEAFGFPPQLDQHRAEILQSIAAD